MNNFIVIMRKGMMVISVFALVYSQLGATVSAANPTCDDHCTDRPYFVVMGGDVLNGSRFFETPSPYDPSLLCYTGFLFEGVGSWNTNDNNEIGNYYGDGYYGGGTQDAIMTDDVASRFVSNLNSDALVGNTDTYLYNYADQFEGPSKLVFSNGPPGNGGMPLSNGGDPSNLVYLSYWAVGGNLYGGNFGTKPCMPDYYADATAESGTEPIPHSAFINSYTVNLAALTGGTYTYTESGGQPLVIDDQAPICSGSSCATAPTTSPITLAVDGNVYIDNDITYKYDSPDDIPQLNVYAYGKTCETSGCGQVVTQTESSFYGNVYIQNNVNEIHGFFVAQGNDQDDDQNNNIPGDPDFFTQNFSIYPNYYAGLFSTCNTISEPSGVVTGSTDDPQCNNKLTIDGSVAAVVFLLERDYGDANSVYPTSSLPACQGSNNTNACNAAELIQYSPETWLPNVGEGDSCAVSVSSCISNTYQAEVNLPPVY